MRQKDQSDFDIERMFEMLDTAMTSKDERVQNAFRSLLTIIALTKPQEDGVYAVEKSYGPLRQMQEELKNITRRLHNLENEMRQRPYVNPQPYNPGAGSPYGPFINPGSPYTIGTDPNGPWTTTGGYYSAKTLTSLQEKEDK
jgi:hypothetical protein